MIRPLFSSARRRANSSHFEQPPLCIIFEIPQIIPPLFDGIYSHHYLHAAFKISFMIYFCIILANNSSPVNRKSLKRDLSAHICNSALLYGIIPSRREPKPCGASLRTPERTLNHSGTVEAVPDQGVRHAMHAALWYNTLTV